MMVLSAATWNWLVVRTASTGCRHHLRKMSSIVEKVGKQHPRIAVCQLTSSADKEENFSVCRSLIEKAKSQGVQMVFLPECFDYIGESIKQSLEQSESLDGHLVSKYKGVAKELQIWLSLGGFHQKNTDQFVKNTHIIINSDGHVVTTYEKIHMFDADIKGLSLHESDYTTPGKCIKPPVVTPVGKVGLGICYDLRFPELALILARQGAELLTYPSAFMEPTGIAHWESLLRSRAIESQCYVIAAAQVGRHNKKRSSYGHAMVIDPWGSIIAECSKGIGLCTAEINMDLLHDVRLEMPVWHHRRNDLYNQIYSFSTENTTVDEQETYKFGHIDIPSTQVFLNTPFSFAFVNIKPVLPGHVLICPKPVVSSFSEVSDEHTSDLWCTARKVGDVVKKHFNGTSLTFAIQDGLEAGQSVKHVHVHVIPRFAGDFSENDDIYRKLQEKPVQGKTLKLRTKEEMEAEARVLRTYFT
ncbi:deaminated glutathione amidase isoform X2 [Octopus bimaculoides]|uniref:deaminated glutathione amidase isoform X2 n=1 Tax=Octopus bimaculoides TaxID=37653 RepID=UPI0022E5CE51|nr:deaminated glutathione amidase isoform X2 [Octopus bimaculoides]